MYKRTLLFFVFILLYSYSSLSQSTARLTVQTGGAVNFYFNSYQKYQNGITYSDILRFSVYFTDTLADGSASANTWKLDVRALDTDIRGITGTLPLSTIELDARHGGGPAANYVAGPIPLTSGDVSLVTAGTQTDLVLPVQTSVYVSLYCGITTPLLGLPLDFYVVDIIFTLGIE